MRISRRLVCVPAVFIAVHLCAGAELNDYQLTGNIRMSSGEPFRRIALNVFLHGASTPFAAQTVADRSGGFSFKNLTPGIYILIVVHAKFGELRRTVEIGPSLADAKGRIKKAIVWEQSTAEKRGLTVSATALSICDQARRLYRKAMSLLGRRDVEGAVSKLKEAVKVAPNYVAALNYLGSIAYQGNNYSQAEEYFRQAMHQDAHSSIAISNLGAVLLAEGKIKDALPYNLDAVRAEPADPSAQARLGRNYFLLGQDGEAEAHLKRAKNLDPSHFSFPQLMLSHIYRRQGDFNSVVRELAEFLSVHPDSEIAGQVRNSLAAARGLANDSGK